MNVQLNRLKPASAERFFAPGVALVLAILAAVQIASIRQEAQTWDEGIHLAAGLSYWKTGDYRMNPQHPPLAKLLCAVPLLFMNVRLPFEYSSWRESDELNFGAQFLYVNNISADEILFPARLVTIVLTLCLGAAIAWWTRRHFGGMAALFAVTLFGFDPNIIAHGRYVTTDLAVTLFSFLACILWGEALTQESPALFAGAGLAVGLALGSKFSALFLIPVFAILGAMRRPTLRGALIAAASALAVLAVLYGRAGPGVYWHGLMQLLMHNQTGHEAYLLGRISEKGWWYYFPVAFAVKTPTAVLVLCAGALLLLRKPFMPRYEKAVLIAPLAIYAAFSIGASLNIGFRHLLPILPFLYVLLAATAATRLPAWFGVAAVTLLAVESLAIYPNYLAFFNWPSGGPEAGPRYLLDSNIDWGQDTKKLKTWLDARGVHRICELYFGSAFPVHYGIDGVPMPGNEDVKARGTPDCIAVASVTPLYGLYVANDRYRWLRELKPTAKIGYSIYVYDLRKGPAQNSRLQ